MSDIPVMEELLPHISYMKKRPEQVRERLVEEIESSLRHIDEIEEQIRLAEDALENQKPTYNEYMVWKNAILSVVPACLPDTSWEITWLAFDKDFTMWAYDAQPCPNLFSGRHMPWRSDHNVRKFDFDWETVNCNIHWAFSSVYTGDTRSHIQEDRL